MSEKFSTFGRFFCIELTTRFFTALYRYFSAHRSVFYCILIATTVVFAFFASRIHLEENILSLLPKTDKNKECAVAFSNVKVKDKIFVEVYSPGATPQELEEEMDRFIEKVTLRDKDTLIGNILYKFDADDIMNVVYYLMDALPCHIGEEFYPLLDSLSNEEAIEGIIAGDKFRDSGTQETVEGAGANEVSGALSEASCCRCGAPLITKRGRPFLVDLYFFHRLAGSPPKKLPTKSRSVTSLRGQSQSQTCIHLRE